MKKYQVAIDRGLSYKYAVQGVLFDDLNQARSMQFMRYVIVWLLRLVAPDSDYPRKNIQYAFLMFGGDRVRYLINHATVYLCQKKNMKFFAVSRSTFSRMSWPTTNSSSGELQGLLPAHELS